MAEPYSVNVRGQPHEIVFPQVCVNCCAPATERVVVERAFCVDTEDHTWTVVRIDPVFCPSCIARHRQEAKPLSSADRIILALKTEMTIAMIGPLLFGGFLMLEALKSFAKSSDPIRAGVVGLVGFFFVLIGVWCFVIGLNKTAHKAITPQTSITGAIQFTEDLSATFEPAWRRFTFSNAAYGQAFADANRDRLWDKHGPDALKAASRRFNLGAVGAIVLGVVVLYWIYDDFLRPYWP